MADSKSIIKNTKSVSRPSAPRKNKRKNTKTKTTKKTATTKTPVRKTKTPTKSIVPNLSKLKGKEIKYKPVIREEIIYVAPENRTTSEIMTRFEYAYVIATRARQFELGGEPFTDVDNITDYKEMAIKEVADKKCPLDIVRKIFDKTAERWHVNEMGIPII